MRVSLMAYRASLGELCATFVLVFTACGSGIAVNQRMAGIEANTDDGRHLAAIAGLSGQSVNNMHCGALACRRGVRHDTQRAECPQSTDQPHLLLCLPPAVSQSSQVLYWEV